MNKTKYSYTATFESKIKEIWREKIAQNKDNNYTMIAKRYKKNLDYLQRNAH